MEHLWDAVTALFSAAVGFIVWMFKKHSDRIDTIDKRLIEVEKDSAVIESKLDDIKSDIEEIKDGIKEIAKSSH